MKPNIGCLRKNLNLFYFFLLDKWTTSFTSFLATPNMSNFNSIWALGEFLFKMGCKFILPMFFLGVSTCRHVAKTAQRLKGILSKKQACFVHKIFGFHFFSIFVFALHSTWYHLQCNCSYLNVKPLVCFKKFYNFQSVGVLSQAAGWWKTI